MGVRPLLPTVVGRNGKITPNESPRLNAGAFHFPLTFRFSELKRSRDGNLFAEPIGGFIYLGDLRIRRVEPFA